MVQYNRLRLQDELLSTNKMRLILVSIGKPEVGMAVCNHLKISNATDWIFCDPQSAMYEALELNTGIQTFVAPMTAFTFRDRIFGMNGRKTSTGSLFDLFEVLSKWKDAVYIPPRADQAFQQGACFIFEGNSNTLFAHYDASTGAHMDPESFVQEAIKLALKP
mmetsp:Transcript_18773/g.26440  ORF Transcript_18773/g.26440 Transcript_18773/m.26440 type:complete len:163 (-) Transcript_18773:601-1089(-)